MKKALLISSILLVSQISFAQIVHDGKNINEDETITFVQLVAIKKLLSQKVKVFIDYGQPVNFSKPQKPLKGPDGKPQVFNSVVAAINFLEQNGWQYKDNMLVGEGSQYVYYYNFKRKKE